MHAEFRPSLSYDIQPDEGPDSWTLHCGESAVNCQDSYELVYEFEKDMTERVQLLRPELYFLHGAALASGSNEKIVDLIHNPQPQNWPDFATPMTPMPQVSNADALKIAAWINSLAK
jgi:hypothetical protein